VCSINKISNLDTKRRIWQSSHVRDPPKTVPGNFPQGSPVSFFLLFSLLQLSKNSRTLCFFLRPVILSLVTVYSISKTFLSILPVGKFRCLFSLPLPLLFPFSRNKDVFRASAPCCLRRQPQRNIAQRPPASSVPSGDFPFCPPS
jgi:hypothetical protein